MDFLKNIFNEDSLDFEQFCQRVSESEIELADLSGGGYVARQEHERQLNEAAGGIEQIKEQYESDILSLKTQNAVNVVLMQNGARDLLSVKAHLDMSAITLTESGLDGLEEQIVLLKQNCPYLFGNDCAEQIKSEKTGMRLSSGMEHSKASQLDYSKLSDSEYYGIMEQQSSVQL